MDTPAPIPEACFRRALVIFNPAAGRRRLSRLRRFLDGMAALGCEVDLHETRRAGDAKDAAANAVTRDADLVVAAGGDGTINEVANGLAAIRNPPPLAILPLGTANVLAAEISLTPTPEAALRAIAAGRRRIIRLGRAGERHFVLMASAGIDAAVVWGVNLALKRRAGRLAYVVEALHQGLTYPFPDLAVNVDGMDYTAAMVVTCKARCYGGPFQAAPCANLSDDRLHAVLLHRKGLPSILRYGVALGMGRLSRLPDVTVVSGRRVKIDAPLGNPVQADGELIGALPMEITVSDRTLELVVP